MIKHYWLEKNSPFKVPMIISMDYYNFEHKGMKLAIAVFGVVAVVMLALTFVYGR